MLRSSLFFSALLIISAALVSAQANVNDEVALKQLVDRMTTAQAAYDADTLDEIFTADYIEISPAGEFDPRAKVLTFYGPEAKAKMTGLSVSVDETFRSIRVYGDTAIVITEMTYMMSKEGVNRPGPKIMTTIVARKENGSWKIASAQYTGIRPPNTAPGQAKPQ